MYKYKINFDEVKTLEDMVELVEALDIRFNLTQEPSELKGAHVKYLIEDTDG